MFILQLPYVRPSFSKLKLLTARELHGGGIFRLGGSSIRMNLARCNSDAHLEIKYGTPSFLVIPWRTATVRCSRMSSSTILFRGEHRPSAANPIEDAGSVAQI
ncbi:hypothetical protein AcV7_004107 [Taiwanofungus camphoratus]|nr:hypothetical protein AcV7_004107 [Antrodia cinnamomea]